MMISKITSSLRRFNRRRLSARWCSSGNADKPPNVKIPNPPDNCCMSGCQNCVWIAYANELTQLYKDSGEQARVIILDKIQDPSLKVFLSLELKNLPKNS